MTHSPLEKTVANHPFVRGMAPAHLHLLAQCAMFTRFEVGQIVFREGEIANRFYLIQQGKVSLETHSPEHGVITVQTLGAGDVLGWSWLFAPYYWHFSACAIEPTQAIFFYGTRLREHCEEDREFGFQLMRRVAAVLMGRLQVTVKESLRLASECRAPTSPP
jgi:CRP/FNR family transcriptional regulator, cyclic AMP receptor protein